MGKKDALSAWISEFVMLVFTQAVQAFIFALVIILIVRVSHGNEGTMNSDSAFGSGVIAIVGLVSISKIEALVKKLMFKGSSLMDTSMGGGAKSVMTGVLAAKAASRAFGNVSKIGKGIKDYRIVGKKEKALTARTNKRLRTFTDNNIGDGNSKADNTTNPGTSSQSNSEKIISTGSANGKQGTGVGTIRQGTGAVNVKQGADSGAGRQGSGSGAGGVSGIRTAAVVGNDNTSGAKINSGRYDATVGNARSNIDFGDGGSDNLASSLNKNLKDVSDSLTRADKDSYYNLMDNYEEKLRDLKAERRKAVGTSIKGVTESVGATLGAVTGATIGIAAGDIGDMIKGVGYGVGVGDMAGEKIVDFGLNATTTATNAKNYVKKQLKNGQRDSIKKQRKELSNMKKQVKTEFEKYGMKVDD